MSKTTPHTQTENRTNHIDFSRYSPILIAVGVLLIILSVIV